MALWSCELCWITLVTATTLCLTFFSSLVFTLLHTLRLPSFTSVASLRLSFSMPFVFISYRLRYNLRVLYMLDMLARGAPSKRSTWGLGNGVTVFS